VSGERPELIWIRKVDAASGVGVWTAREKSAEHLRVHDIPYAPYDAERERLVEQLIRQAESVIKYGKTQKGEYRAGILGLYAKRLDGTLAGLAKLSTKPREGDE